MQTVELLRARGLKISENALRLGLKNAFMPGRLEVVSQRPVIVLDVAHNEASIHSTLQWLNATYPSLPRRIVFAVSSDKAWKPMLNQLAERAERLYLTRYTTNPRALPVSELATYAQAHAFPFTAGEDPVALTRQALRETRDTGLLLAVGSFFLIGQLKTLFEPE